MFRLLTYNICRGGGGREDAIAQVISSCSPDVVLLQEATVPAAVERIARAAGLEHWRAYTRQSLACLSRRPITHAAWHRPRFSRHAFIEVVPEQSGIRLFGVHLSAIFAAWTERRRTMELRALLRSVQQHQDGFHVLAGDFNTVAPGDLLEVERLPLRLRPFIWMSGGQIRWRTIQAVLEAGYHDSYRMQHPGDPGMTLPTTNPHVRLDYVFVPARHAQRVLSCDVVRHPDAARASDHFPVLATLQPDLP